MVLTPNMALIQPTIGLATGLEWEQAYNANQTTLDGHNHSPGSGVPINQNGIVLTADFTFLSFNAIALRSARFVPQSAPLALAADLGCLYVSGVDLWYNDVNGNQVQMTSGGSVLATSSGISSGTATASFSSSVLIVNAASNTPANIRGASLLLGNNVVASKYLTLSPPNAMAANYGLVLPALPGSTLFVTLDSSGNFGNASSIPATQIANGSLTYAQLAAGFKPPTVQVFTTGSGTYTRPSSPSPLYLRVRVVGGGGGGCGSGTAGGTGPTAGASSTFGSNITSTGGGAGNFGAGGGGGGTGTVSGGLPGFGLTGQTGGYGNNIFQLVGANTWGGIGGGSAFFGGGGAQQPVGVNGVANTGGGGSGAAVGASPSGSTGAGGGGGGSSDAIISSPSATYSYAVGAGGTAGGAGTGGSAGGAGAKGIIIVEEFYE